MAQEMETCVLCGDLTGKAGKGEDSLYSEWAIKPPTLHYEVGEEIGPLCASCFDCLIIVGVISG